MGRLRGHPPTVPWDILARDYIDCVEAGLPPGKTLRQRYGISDRAWQDKRIHMSHEGWLPPGEPKLGQKQHGGDWAQRAREVLSARIRLRAREVRDHEAAVRAAQEARASLEGMAAERERRRQRVLAERTARIDELAALASPEDRAALGRRLTASCPPETVPKRSTRGSSRAPGASSGSSGAVLEVFL